MKKLMISAALASSMLAAAPLVAQEAPVSADPFVSSQGGGTALGIVGGMTVLVLIAAASNDSSSGTD